MTSQVTAEEKQELQREGQRLQRELDSLTRKIDLTYEDKLSGVITEAFWTRRQEEYSTHQKHLESELLRVQQPQSAADALTVSRILELTQKAYSLYVTQEPPEQRKLLDILLSNSKLAGGGVELEYHEPFGTIAVGVSEEEALGQGNGHEKAKRENWLPGLDEEANFSQNSPGYLRDGRSSATPAASLLETSQAEWRPISLDAGPNI